MDEAPGAIPPELERLIEETRSRLADMRQALDHARALTDGIVERLDRSEERFARLQARRLARVSADGLERDQIVLRVKDEEILERTMAREIDRRVAEGWSVAGIVYDPHETGRVEIAFQRAKGPESPAVD